MCVCCHQVRMEACHTLRAVCHTGGGRSSCRPQQPSSSSLGLQATGRTLTRSFVPERSTQASKSGQLILLLDFKKKKRERERRGLVTPCVVFASCFPNPPASPPLPGVLPAYRRCRPCERPRGILGRKVERQAFCSIRPKSCGTPSL